MLNTGYKFISFRIFFKKSKTPLYLKRGDGGNATPFWEEFVKVFYLSKNFNIYFAKYKLGLS